MTFRQLIGQASAFRYLLVISALWLTMESLITLALPIVAGQTLSALDSPGLVAADSAFLIVPVYFTGLAFVRYMRLRQVESTHEIILSQLRIQVFSHLQRLPFLEHAKASKGDFQRLLSADIYDLSGFLARDLVSVGPQIIKVGGSIIILFLLNPNLALPMALVIPIIFVLRKIGSYQLRPLAREIREANARSADFFHDSLNNFALNQAFNLQEVRSRTFETISRQIQDLTTSMAKRQAMIGPMSEAILAIGMTALIWLMRERLKTDQMSTPEIVAFLLYLVLLIRPLSDLMSFWGRVEMVRGSLDRLDTVLNIEAEPQIKRAEFSSSIFNNGIKFSDVSFAYEDRAPVFENLNIEFLAHSVTAITGPNGFGKSTMVHLLLKFLIPASGDIKFGTHAIEDIPTDELRAQIGYVPQRPQLFHDTIRYNITLNRQDENKEQLAKAMEMAHLSPMLERFDQGLDTMIGSGGLRLSGGEKQRIALARALFSNPKILILDEPAAMLDVDGEAHLLSQKDQLFEGRTVLMISHNPSVLSLADRVLYLDRLGRISDRT